MCHDKLAQAAPEAKIYEFQSGGMAWLVATGDLVFFGFEK